MERGENAYDSTRVKRELEYGRGHGASPVSFKSENVKPSRHNHGFRYTRMVRSQTHTVYTYPPARNVFTRIRRAQHGAVCYLNYEFYCRTYCPDGETGLMVVRDLHAPFTLRVNVRLLRV